MDLLSAFYFTFEADAKKLDAGLDASKKKSKEVEDALQGADKIAKELGKSFLDMAKKGAEALGAVLALGAIKKLTVDTADHTYAVYQQARAMAVSTETLSTWQHAVVSAGGTADQATTSMGNLRDRFVEMTKFGGVMGQDSFLFRKLGLTPEEIKASVEDPTIALSKLAETFGKLNTTQAMYLGKRLGLDPATIALLSQGRRAFDDQIARQKSLGVVTQEQALAAAKFKMAQAELGQVFETVAREVTSEILPAFTWLLQKVEQGTLYFRDHKTFVVAFFTGIAIVVADVYVPAMYEAVTATLAFLAPIIGIPLLVGAVIAVIALFVDDLVNFMEGHNSVIGELAKKWPWFGDIVRGVVHAVMAVLKVLNATIKDAFAYFGALLDFIGDIFTKGPSKALDELNSKTAKIFKDMAGHFTGVVTAAKETAKGIVGAWDAITGSGDKSIAPKVAGSGGASSEAIAAANAAQAKYGVPAQVTLAQYALESGNGKHMPAGSNNPFGIKARAGQPYVEAMTTEVVNGKTEHVMQRFAKFDSLQDAFEQHAKLLATGSAYANARTHKDDPDAYADALTGKYATDPQYGAKLKAIMAKQHLDTVATGPVIAQQETIKAVAAAKAAVGQANAPISSQGSGVISNQATSTRNTTVDVGGVTVHAPGADGKEIGQTVSGHLQQHMSNAVDQNDDGVAA